MDTVDAGNPASPPRGDSRSGGQLRNPSRFPDRIRTMRYISATTALQQHSALAQCSTFAIILASFALIWARLAALGETSETRHVLRCIAPARASATLVIVKLPASLPSERRSTGASLAWRQQAGLHQPFELVETGSGSGQTSALACYHSPSR